MVHLPENVMVDVLSRLPVKSLLRFRCVCKEWLSLISSSSSVKGSVKHLHNKRRSSKNRFLLIWNNDLSLNNCHSSDSRERYVNSVSLRVVDMVAERVHEEFKFDVHNFVFQDSSSCRDLICFIGWKVYMCNPSTREFVEVPDCDKDGSIALGYMPLTKQYKLVRWFSHHDYTDDIEACYDNNCEMGCEVLTITDGEKLEFGSWRVTRNLPCVAVDSHAVCVNGAIFWLLSYYHYGGINSKSDLILSFDLNKEESKFFSCPESHPDGSYLLELKGKLWLVHPPEGADQSIIKTWFLEDGRDWVVGYKINVALVRHDIFKLKTYNPADDNNSEELVFKAAEKNGVIYYNIANKSFRGSQKFQHLSGHGYEWLSIYLDSFFSLGRI